MTWPQPPVPDPGVGCGASAQRPQAGPWLVEHHSLGTGWVSQSSPAPGTHQLRWEADGAYPVPGSEAAFPCAESVFSNATGVFALKSANPGGTRGERFPSRGMCGQAAINHRHLNSQPRAGVTALIITSCGPGQSLLGCSERRRQHLGGMQLLCLSECDDATAAPAPVHAPHGAGN